jgi:hypothetical protein
MMAFAPRCRTQVETLIDVTIYFYFLEFIAIWALGLLLPASRPYDATIRHDHTTTPKQITIQR